MMKFTKPTGAELDNRFNHHAPSTDQVPRYEENRAAIKAAAKVVVKNTPCCPEQSIALNKLDEAMFFANAAIARAPGRKALAPQESEPADHEAAPAAPAAPAATATPATDVDAVNPLAPVPPQPPQPDTNE